MTHPYATLRTGLLAETKTRIAAAVNTDQLILQASTSLDQVEKAAHRLIKKTREWYSLHNPEHEKAIKDHETFIAEAELSEKGTMGAELAHDDKEAIESMIISCTKLLEEKEKLLAYIEAKMVAYAPNLSYLAGSRIAAQLLAQAGSLKRLATVPSSTLQLFGAETALFRHLRNRGRHKSPKYGIIFNHQLIQKLPQQQKGKAARALADKLSLCAKLDLFKGEEKAAAYKKLLEERFTTW